MSAAFCAWSKLCICPTKIFRPNVCHNHILEQRLKQLLQPRASSTQKALAFRQWDEEEKSRQQHNEPLSNGHEEDSLLYNDDAVSSKGGVLHEEIFIETKSGAEQAGLHDVEAPHSSQQEEGLLAVLKIVDWWEVCRVLLVFAC